jgi:hypothetical protein
MRVHRLWIVGALALACSDKADSGATGTEDARSAITGGGTWTVSYAPDPDPVPGNEEFALDLTVEDDAGPASGTSILLTADMPEHGHGMNQTPVVSGSDGSFRADGMLFHMTGDWRLTVDVTGDAGTESAELWVTCCE